MKIGFKFIFALCTTHLIVQVASLRCFVGQQSETTARIDVFPEVECGATQQSCMTRVEINQNLKFVTQSCKATDACLTQEAGNEYTCYSGDSKRKMQRVCHYCCSEDLCNNITTIQPRPGK